MKLSNYKLIHFIGIGGISMSAIAEILKNKGCIISGSDGTKSETTDHLKKIGIDISIGHNKNNIPMGCSLVVYTAAIPEDNCEITEARARGIKTVERAVLLGLLMQEYKYPICISGTHGKTTTTSMVSEIFLADNADPTIMVGGILPSIGGNFRFGKNEYFIAESCEYCDSFLSFYPHSAIILNVDHDHTDYFPTIEDTYRSFNKFACLVPSDGFIVINADIPNLGRILDNTHCTIITYGENGDISPKNIRFDENGCAEYDIILEEEEFTIKLSVPGIHNVYNSVAAAVLASAYGIDKESIIKGLENFTGTHRRFEIVGKKNGAVIVDDYAHHPTEIKATVASARAHEINRLICVFQPHTYSRTKSFLKEFAEAFRGADKVIVTDIYAAREPFTDEISSEDIVKLMKRIHIDAVYIPELKAAAAEALSILDNNDMLITIGAGNVYTVGQMILDKKVPD